MNKKKMGEIERLIIRCLADYNVPTNFFCRLSEDDIAKYGRRFIWGMVPTLAIRNHIYGVGFYKSEGLEYSVTNSERASFSRAIKSLERKGLVRTHSDVSRDTYRLLIQLTDVGREYVNNWRNKELLTHSVGGAVE